MIGGKVIKMYNVQDLANYNRIVNLPNGHEVRFNEFNAEVKEDDIDWFRRQSDFQIRVMWEINALELTDKMLKKAPIAAVIETDGLMYGVSGFAEALRNVTYHLYEKNLIMTARPGDRPDADGVKILSTKKGRAIRDLAFAQYEYKGTGKCPRISIQMTVPDGIHMKRDTYNIAYIMFETIDFPEKYVRHLENNAHEIWTPSQFNVDNMRRAGWKKPIYRMPLGADTERFDPSKIKPFKVGQAPISFYQDRFVFLSIMGWSERKGISTLLEAYLKEFDESEDVTLYLKGGWYDEKRANDEVQNAVNQFKPGHTPQVVTDFKIYSDQEHPRLYKSSGAFVLPSLGEGWGLNYTEAMSMELPTLGTASTSMTDYMDDTNSFPIKIGKIGTESRCDWVSRDYVGAKFAQPDVNSLREQMRYVFDHQEEAKKVGKKARQDMIKKWSWDKAANMQIKRLKEIVKGL